MLPLSRCSCTLADTPAALYVAYSWAEKQVAPQRYKIAYRCFIPTLHTGLVQRARSGRYVRSRESNAISCPATFALSIYTVRVTSIQVAELAKQQAVSIVGLYEAEPQVAALNEDAQTAPRAMADKLISNGCTQCNLFVVKTVQTFLIAPERTRELFIGVDQLLIYRWTTPSLES